MQPLFYAALAFAAGIATAGTWQIPVGVAEWASAGALAAWALIWLIYGNTWLHEAMPPAAKAGALAVLFLAGSWWYPRCAAQPAGNDSLARAVAAWQLGPRETITIGGYLRDDPERGGDYTRFDLEAEFIARGAGAGAIQSVQGGVRVYLTAQGSPEAAAATPAGAALSRAGQAVEIVAHPRPLRQYVDPGVPEFNRRARQEGIDLVASVAPQAVMPLPEIRGPAPARWRAALWRRLSAAVDALAPPGGAPRVNALLRGMLLGDTARLDEATRQDFQIDGIYHVLVVAGLHIGILALFFVWGLRRLGCPPGWAGAICLVLLAAYAWTISGRTPTLRVLLMLSVYFVARAWYRQRQALNAVGAAGLILLIWRPGALFEAGFQMSFGAALLLAGVVAPHFERGPRQLRRCTRQLDDAGYDETFPPRWAQRRLDLRALAQRLRALWPPLAALLPPALRGVVALYEVVFISLVLQWGLAAFMAVYFHRVTPWAALVNAAVVPAVGVLLPVAWALAGWQMLHAGVHLPAAPAWAGTLPRGLGRAVLHLAHAAAGWPLAAARVPSPPGWALAVFAGLVALWLVAARRGGPAWRWATLAVAIAAQGLAWLPFAPRLMPGALTVTALDVGQGDAIFVAFPHGRTLLVDAGPRSAAGFDSGEEIVAPYLWSLGLRRLDAVLLTHAHSDHMGGMPFIIGTFRPRELWVTETLPPEPAVATLLHEAVADGARIARRHEGERFRIGGCELDVLLPSPDYRSGATAKNQDSMVVRIRDGAASVLLEGDAEAEQERAMLASGLPLASTLLKVGHHGSRTSSIPPFLAAVDPAADMISVGAGNSYGHPSPAVVAQLEANGARVFRTDQGGAIEAQFRDGMLRIYRFAPRP